MKPAPALMFCTALLAALGLGPAGAGPAPDEAQARYRAERAACLKGDAIQDRATCLKEARAALAEARRRPQPAAAADYRANALARCERRPEHERADCRQMMEGAGSRSGSVAEGAIIRELRSTTPAASAAP